MWAQVWEREPGPEPRSPSQLNSRLPWGPPYVVGTGRGGACISREGVDAGEVMLGSLALPRRPPSAAASLLGLRDRARGRALCVVPVREPPCLPHGLRIILTLAAREPPSSTDPVPSLFPALPPAPQETLVLLKIRALAPNCHGRSHGSSRASSSLDRHWLSSTSLPPTWPPQGKGPLSATG